LDLFPQSAAFVAPIRHSHRFFLAVYAGNAGDLVGSNYRAGGRRKNKELQKKAWKRLPITALFITFATETQACHY